MSERVEHHIYRNEQGRDRGRVAILPGDALDIDANVQDFDSDTFLEAVKEEPGEYVVVCLRPDAEDSDSMAPNWLYRVAVAAPEHPRASVTAVGAHA